MKMPLESLRNDVRMILLSNGVPPEEAESGVEVCLDAELRGRTSHGVRLLRNVLIEYANGASRRGEIQIARETPVSAQVDGGFHLSWHVHRLAVDLVARKAEASGIAIVSVSNAGVSGALGYLAERIAAGGLVGLAMNSSPVTVVAPGASIPGLGTNPLAIALPRRARSPLVLDMATSAVAFNQILNLRDSGRPLPNDVAVDASGQPTTNPEKAIDPRSGRGRILPFGGHRGYGLTLMLELMVSAGVTGRTGQDKRGPIVLEPADFSGLYLAYRPDLVGDAELAMDATERLLDELVSEGVRIPGETSRRRREAGLRDQTFDVSNESLEILRSLKDNSGARRS